MPLARELGWNLGKLSPGSLNSITDVPGVRVGHVTIRRDNLMTGVTAILPHGGNMFRDKVVAGVDVINGFGKSVGLMQLAELGTIETPIVITNTLNVGVCMTALIRHAIKANPDIGRETGTVNPVVCECNDGKLSDIQAIAVTEADTLAALEAASDKPVEQGSVGAGTGMTSFGFKSGIGSASRRIDLDGGAYHLGVLVNSNCGNRGDLILPDGQRPVAPVRPAEERGSIIMIVATDVPLTSRQLHRVARRCGAGVARLGAYWGNGSGDIAVAFSTATKINHDEKRDIVDLKAISEKRIDLLFQAASDCTQEAVLNSMLLSPATTRRDKNVAPSLAQEIKR